MAARQHPEPNTFGRRLEKWARDSAELRAWVQQATGGPATPEVAALRRYQRSKTGELALPHPMLTPRHYDALGDRRRQLSQRVVVASLAVPLLIVLGVALGPVAAKIAVLSLLVPLAGLIAHHARELTALERQRLLALRGGLADAWADWVRARDQVDALEHASQARAALGVNETRMQHLVLVLARADAQPDHRDTEEHRASRAWVFETAAKAVALAEAERALEVSTQLEVEAGDLRFAPEGDANALDDALESAREIAREQGEPGQLGHAGD